MSQAKSKFFLLFFMILFSITPVFAGFVKGRVIDNDSKKPLIRATITLHNPSSNKQIAGGYADKNGNFNIRAEEGNYKLKIAFIGYDEQLVTINITETKPYDVGTITLKMSSVLTEGIEVTAKRESIEVGLDRKVFNIEQDITSLGGSAIDVLANIPSVTVDQDDNVSLRGNDNVKIMIDGRASNLSASEALQQIPATMISSVELITNPGARYEADGTAGIINIVTTKQRDNGLNGMLNFSAGVDDDINMRGNTGININYNYNKINIFANFNGRLNNRSGESTMYRTLWDADAVPNYSTDISTNNGGGRFLGGNIGADYNFSKSDILTYSYRINRMKRSRDNTSNYLSTNYLGDTTNYYDRIENNNPPFGMNTEHTLSWTHRFENKGHELYADLFYSIFDREGLSSYEQSNYFPTINQTKQQNINDMKSNSITAQADYAQPIGTNFKLEVGGKYSSRNSDINNHLDNLIDNSWVTDVWSSDQFEYNENILAAYVTGSSKFKNLSLNIGVRSETTIIDFNSIRDSSASFNDNYTLFFPSLYLNYELTEHSSLSGNFSSRMKRPNYWDLNPVMDYGDPLNLRKGNPGLRPEHHYIFELGYLMNYNLFTFTSTLFYRYSTDGIQMYKEMLNGDTTLVMPHNVSKSSQMGLDLIGMYKPFETWKLDGSWSIYNSKVDATNIGGQNRNATNWNARINSSYDLAKWCNWVMTFGYRSKMITAQGEMEPSWNLDASFRFILSRQLSFNLRVQDIFNTRQWNMWEAIPGVLYSERASKFNSRNINIGITYRINNFKQKKERNSDNDNRLSESD